MRPQAAIDMPGLGTGQVLSPSQDSAPSLPQQQQPVQDEEDPPVPVAVAVRICPPKAPNQQKCIAIKKNELNVVSSTVPEEKFRFENIFDDRHDQESVFVRTLQPFVPLIFDGFDVFVLVYGGASCGKSYTLFGPQPPLRSESELGLIPRLVRELFNYEIGDDNDVTVKASGFDVSNDDVCDLRSSWESNRNNQRRRSLISTNFLAQETEIDCNEVADVLNCYESCASLHNLKNASSQQESGQKSHLFFKVKVEQRVANLVKKSTITFVDLASPNQMLGQHGDHGLISLNRIVSKLDGPRSSANFIPEFQDSYLTRYLWDALGGKALTLLVTCVSSLTQDCEDTLSSLMFAKRVSRIASVPEPNVKSILEESNDCSVDEELRAINSTNRQPPPGLPYAIPDLIHPHLSPHQQQLLAQQQQLLQQQMLANYMVMLQQNQVVQNPSPAMTSPFIPISSDTVSPLSQKSPLNVQMYLPSMPAASAPILGSPPVKETSTTTTPPTNVPVSMPSQDESASEEQSKDESLGAIGKTKRKSSLAAQKTLASITEESERSSSKKSTASLTPTSQTSLAESGSDDETTSSLSSFEESNSEEDFDSDCSDVSELEEASHDQIENILEQFNSDTKNLVDKTQKEILEENSDADGAGDKAVQDLAENLASSLKLNKLTQAYQRKKSEAEELAENMEGIEDHLETVKRMIVFKNSLVAEAESEIDTSRKEFEAKLETLKLKASEIRKKKSSASRALSKAKQRKESKQVKLIAFINSKTFIFLITLQVVRELEAKLEGYKDDLNSNREQVEALHKAIERVTDFSLNRLTSGSLDEMRSKQMEMEALLKQQHEKRRLLEAELEDYKVSEELKRSSLLLFHVLYPNL